MKKVIPAAAILCLTALSSAASTLTFTPAPEAVVEQTTTFMPGWMKYCATNGKGDPDCIITDWTLHDLAEVSASINYWIIYEEDQVSHGMLEHWSVFPADRLGDCDDYAMTKKAALIGMGYPAHAISLAYATLPAENGQPAGAHLFTIVSLNGELWVLDSMRTSETADDYLSIWNINEPPYGVRIELYQRPDGRWVPPIIMNATPE